MVKTLVKSEPGKALTAGGVITFVPDSSTPASTTFDGSNWRTTVAACQVTACVRRVGGWLGFASEDISLPANQQTTGIEWLL